MANIVGTVAGYTGSVPGLYLNTPQNTPVFNPTPAVVNVPLGGSIQSAIDSVQNIANAAIQVASGTYVGNLVISSRSSSMPAADTVMPASGTLSIIGDTRAVAGACFMHGGLNTNGLGAAGLGTDQATVTLSTGLNSVSVALSAGVIDFAVLGVVAGDILKLRDNTGAWFERIVTSAVGNTLSYSGVGLTIGGVYPVGYCSAVVVCPRVIIQASSAANSNTIYISDASVILKGLWINAKNAIPLLQGLAGMQSARLTFLNCFWDDAFANLAAGISALITAKVESHIETCAFADMVSPVSVPSTIVQNSGVRLGKIYIIDGSAYFGGLSVFGGGGADSAIQVEECQAEIVGVLQTVNARGVVCQASTLIQEGNVVAMQTVTGFYFITTSVSSSGVALIDGSSDGITPLAGGRGVRERDSSRTVLTGMTIRLCATGVSLNASSFLNLSSDAGLSGNLSNYAVSGGSVLVLGNVAGNVRLIASAGAGVMESNFPVQSITAAGAALLTLNPAQVTDGLPTSLGKEYLLVSQTAQAHTLTLPGAFFFGAGTGTVATFSAAIGNYIKFTVISGTFVLVSSKSAGVTIA